MPTSDLFVTSSVKPAMADTTLPKYDKLNNEVLEENPRDLKSMETFAGGAIADNAELARVKKDINIELMNIMSQRNVLSNMEVVPYSPTLKERLIKESDIANKVSKVCESILDFNIGDALAELLGLESWSKWFKEVLKGLGIDSDLLEAMLSCGQASTKQGMALAKDAVPVLAGDGNAMGVSAIVSKYGGKAINNLGGSVSDLADNMEQTPSNVDEFTYLIENGDPKSVSRFTLVGTDSRGYNVYEVEEIKTTLVAESPIGDLMDPSRLSPEMKQSTKCDNILNNGNSLLEALYPDSNDKIEIEMARAAMRA